MRLARKIILVSVCYCFINTHSYAQPNNQKAITQQLLGCWRNVAEPSSQVCFETDGRLLFKNDQAGKTIRRRWKFLSGGLIRIKFIFLFKPTYQIQNISKHYVKLVPVNKGIIIELQR
jgi:hypothetical protein